MLRPRKTVLSQSPPPRRARGQRGSGRGARDTEGRTGRWGGRCPDIQTRRESRHFSGLSTHHLAPLRVPRGSLQTVAPVACGGRGGRRGGCGGPCGWAHPCARAAAPSGGWAASTTRRCCLPVQRPEVRAGGSGGSWRCGAEAAPGLSPASGGSLPWDSCSPVCRSQTLTSPHPPVAFSPGRNLPLCLTNTGNLFLGMSLILA